jgi:hypothetical protein
VPRMRLHKSVPKKRRRSRRAGMEFDEGETVSWKGKRCLGRQAWPR